MKLTIQDALEKDKSQYPHALLRSIPPKLCFLFFLRPVPPWVSLLCAWAKVKHLPLSWSKPVQVSTFNISFLLFFFLPLHSDLFASWALSLRLEHKRASVIVLGRAVLRLSSSAPRLAASPCYSKGCWRGETQVCVVLGQSRVRADPGTKRWMQKKGKKRNEMKGGGKNPGWQNLKKKKMSEAPISLNKRLTDGSSLGRWEINTKIIKLK